MTTDYLKQKGFSENGEVKLKFEDLAKLLDDHGSDAISFTNWITNYYNSHEVEPGMWIDRDPFTTRLFTTEELYLKYLKHR